jgi:hypothetical protein
MRNTPPLVRSGRSALVDAKVSTLDPLLARRSIRPPSVRCRIPCGTSLAFPRGERGCESRCRRSSASETQVHVTVLDRGDGRSQRRQTRTS